MIEQTCPWCQETLSMELEPATAEQTCPLCLTSWSYVEEPAELAAAA